MQTATVPAVMPRQPEPDPTGLVYVSDTVPGIRRRKARQGFRYLQPNGKVVTDTAALQRIKSLAIPPAWRRVWICTLDNGHIQATGRDDRGRKQYRYHPLWTASRDANKFQQLENFAQALPRIRRSVRRDMSSRGICHEKMVALAVRLLELTLIRVGSEEYARTNKSYGLTTLRRRHVRVRGAMVRLRFKGKSGVQHDITVNDRQIAAILKRCLDIPGQELLQYRARDGSLSNIDSTCVNNYLKLAGRADFTARHYRTWAACVYTMRQLQRSVASGAPVSKAELTKIIAKTAARLAHTPAICRKCYVHPALLRAYLEGRLPLIQPLKTPAGLYADERRFLAFLQSLKQ